MYLPLLPVDAALSIFNVGLLLTQISEKESMETTDIATNPET